MPTNAFPQPAPREATGPYTGAPWPWSAALNKAETLKEKTKNTRNPLPPSWPKSRPRVTEQVFATEIIGANWRLRRCRNLEFDLARATGTAPEAQDALQKSIDRAALNPTTSSATP